MRRKYLISHKYVNTVFAQTIDVFDVDRCFAEFEPSVPALYRKIEQCPF